METNLNLDTKKFLTTTLKEISEDIKWVYPMGRYYEDRAHQTLQKVKGKIKVLRNMLEAMEPSETSK